MIIKFINTIVFVSDIQTSKKFYTKLLDLQIEKEFETIVFFSNEFIIHDAANIFEPPDLDSFYKKLAAAGVQFIHFIEKQEWGQRIFRFFDPDGHIVEVGESL